MMGSWESSAKILNAHFHVLCHGEIPLYMDWNAEAQQAAAIDEKDLEFLTTLKSMVEARGMHYLQQATFSS